MTFDEYQKNAKTTDLTAGKGEPSKVLTIAFMDKLLGLVGESGEIAEKVKKILRDKEGQISQTDKQELVKELGDVLWYVALVADNLGVSFDEVATKNINKLAERSDRGSLSGSGDNR